MIGGRGFGQMGTVGLVLGDWESQAVVADEGFEGANGLFVVIFKSGVDCDHGHFIGVERFGHARRLRQAMLQ